MTLPYQTLDRLPGLETAGRRVERERGGTFDVGEASALRFALRLMAFESDDLGEHATAIAAVGPSPEIRASAPDAPPSISISWTLDDGSAATVRLLGLTTEDLLRHLMPDARLVRLLAAADDLAAASIRQITTTDSIDDLLSAATAYEELRRG